MTAGVQAIGVGQVREDVAGSRRIEVIEEKPGRGWVLRGLKGAGATGTFTPEWVLSRYPRIIPTDTPVAVGQIRESLDGKRVKLHAYDDAGRPWRAVVLGGDVDLGQEWRSNEEGVRRMWPVVVEADIARPEPPVATRDASCSTPLPDEDAVRTTADGRERVVWVASGPGATMHVDHTNFPACSAREALCKYPIVVTTEPERLVLRAAGAAGLDVSEDWRKGWDLRRAVLEGKVSTLAAGLDLVRETLGEKRWGWLPVALRRALEETLPREGETYAAYVARGGRPWELPHPDHYTWQRGADGEWGGCWWGLPPAQEAKPEEIVSVLGVPATFHGEGPVEKAIAYAIADALRHAPVVSFSAEERAMVAEGVADVAAGRTVPGEAVSLSVALRVLREGIVPALDLSVVDVGGLSLGQHLQFIDDTMVRAEAWIRSTYDDHAAAMSGIGLTIDAATKEVERAALLLSRERLAHEETREKLSAVEAHRDELDKDLVQAAEEIAHLRARVDDLQTTGTRLVERVRVAEERAQPIGTGAFMDRMSTAEKMLHAAEARVRVLETERPRMAVGVLVRRADGTLLLGQRLVADGQGTWSTPGGWIEPGETPLHAAVRELAEEAGIVVAEEGVRLLPLRTIAPAEGDLPEVVLCWAVVDVGNHCEAKLLEPTKCSRWEWFIADETTTGADLKSWDWPDPLSRGTRSLLSIVDPHDIMARWKGGP